MHLRGVHQERMTQIHRARRTGCERYRTIGAHVVEVHERHAGLSSRREKARHIDVRTDANARRRVAHLLTMYGFVLYVVSTAVMVFCYPTLARLDLWPQLWWLGGLMVCVGGYWFWFFIRVDVAAEGHTPFRVVRADLFILSLLASVTLGLLWAWLHGWVLFGLYVLATTVLFGSVPWSKFAHMFFKPAAAFEKRVSYANGTRSNLPAPVDKPEQFGSARTAPRHY